MPDEVKTSSILHGASSPHYYLLYYVLYFLCCLFIIIIIYYLTTTEILTLVPSLPRVLSGIPFYIIIVGPSAYAVLVIHWLLALLYLYRVANYIRSTVQTSFYFLLLVFRFVFISCL